MGTWTWAGDALPLYSAIAGIYFSRHYYGASPPPGRHFHLPATGSYLAALTVSAFCPCPSRYSASMYAFLPRRTHHLCAAISPKQA